MKIDEDQLEHKPMDIFDNDDEGDGAEDKDQV